MKTKNINLTKLLILMIVIFGALMLFSCSKDNDNKDMSADEVEALDEFTEDYFNILGSSFSNANLPTPNSDNLNIIGIAGNSTVLAGEVII